MKSATAFYRRRTDACPTTPTNSKRASEKNDLFGREAPRSALAARVFAIPDALIEDFLESDIERLSKSYVHTLAPDLELMRSFGTVDMTEQIKEIVRDYGRKNRRRDQRGGKKKIGQTKNATSPDIAGMRDRIRGTYALPKTPTAFCCARTAWSGTSTIQANWGACCSRPSWIPSGWAWPMDCPCWRMASFP